MVRHLLGMTSCGAAAFLCLAAAPAARAIPVSDDYELIWHDEFDGQSLDEAKWRHWDLGPRRQAVNVPQAVSVSDGVMTITTHTAQTANGLEHRTGIVGTHQTFLQKYGYFEARIDFDSAPGMWSAFWIFTDNLHNQPGPFGPPEAVGVEIDVMEHRLHNQWGGDISNSAVHNIHWDGYGADHKVRGHFHDQPGIASGFHTYGLEWTPDGYRFFIDGEQVWDGADAPVSDVAQYLLLSSEVEGGTWAGAVPGGGYGSLAESTTKMKVDYVRVYSTTPIPEPSTAGLLLGGVALLCSRTLRRLRTQ